MRRPDRFFSLAVSVLLTVAVVIAAPVMSWSAISEKTAAPAGDIEKMMAGLSDEQARQLLLDELRKEAQAEAPAAEQIRGPASFLAKMLSTLSGGHDNTMDQIGTLFSSFPKMGPDLYKVFIKL